MQFNPDLFAFGSFRMYFVTDKKTGVVYGIMARSRVIALQLVAVQFNLKGRNATEFTVQQD